MQLPRFWAKPGGSWQSALLGPAAAVYAWAGAKRMARPGAQVPVPVICCGNATVGGAGKTALALDLVRRLAATGRHPHVLLRGYGGAVRGPHLVGADDTHRQVGDEALLLARAAPTWVGADRTASARRAIAAGADVLVMDDGLQNPGLEKTAALLVVDGGFGFGNCRVFPAGPLREPVEAAARRCRAAVLIGEDVRDAAAKLPPHLPVLRARMMPGPELAALRGREVVAFAGIGRPEKFFAMLRDAGVHVAEAVAFPDHHAFSASEIARLRARKIVLVTTEKDAVRLPSRDGVVVASVRLEWEGETGIGLLIQKVLAG